MASAQNPRAPKTKAKPINALTLVPLLALIAAFAALVSGRVRRNTGWSATIAPLASIIGSGFLVSVPLLATFGQSRMGVWACAKAGAA